MRINNPRSLAGFTTETTANDVNFKLATVGQVKNAVVNINTKFIKLLNGPDGEDTPSPVHGNGYAWLASDGKIDPALLPSLAITETHVVTQSTVKGMAGNDVYTNLDLWIKATTGEVFQRGDIIIVTNANPVNAGTTENEGQYGESVIEPVDPQYVGTYIITAVPPEGSEVAYTFAKMAYSAANIVTINGVAPETTAGNVQILLKDILSQETYLGKDAAETDAEGAVKLSDVVYRLAKIDEGNDKFRFGFLDKKDSENVFVPYARLSELTDETAAREAAFTELSNALTNLNTLVVANDGVLSTAIDTINDTIGNATIAPSADFNYPIIGQIKQLRNDVDYNASLLDQTREDTNALVTSLSGAIAQVRNDLNEKAVSVVEKTITWGGDETAYQIIDNATAGFAGETIEDPGLSGIVKWTYTYTPAIASNTTSAFDNGVVMKNSPKSDEKIIGIFDDAGNQIIADIERTKLTSADVWQSKIIVQTNWYGETPASMVGQVWHLVIAKTVVDIPCDLPAAPAVGGSSNVNVAKTAGTASI